jgi:hypothetical protein
VKRGNAALVASFLVLAYGCSWLYDVAPRALAELVLPVFAVTLVLAPSLLYPILRWRGESAAVAIAASLLLPASWLALECYRTARVFTWGEGLYYAFNPLMQGLASMLAVQLAGWEIARRAVRRQPLLPGWPVWTLATIASFWTVVTIANHGRDATAIHYAYIEIYRRLFGP